MGVNEQIADLIAAFPRDKITLDTAKIYIAKLSDIPPDMLALAVHDLCCTSERFPTIRAIREAVAERTLAVPSEAEALMQIEAWVTGRVEPHPLARRVLRLIGGTYAYRTAENPSVIRGQFLRLYREQRAAAVREALVGAPLALGTGRPPLAVSCNA